MRQLGNTTQQHQRTSVIGDILDKGTIDFDLGQRQAVEIAQAGIARTKIVQRNVDPGILQSLQDQRSLIAISDDRTFGHFHLKLPRRKAGFLQGIGDIAGNIAVFQINR